MKLRAYQKEALYAIDKAFRAGVTRQMVVLPTGAGKTVIMGNVIASRNGRALFLAHRLELITQAAKSIKHIVGDTRSVATSNGYIGDDKDCDPLQADIFIGTIQSCKSSFIKKLLAYGPISTLVIDEAHHSSARSYRMAIASILNLDDKFEKKDDSESLLIGCTATPSRSDGVTIKGIFQTIVYSISIRELMEMGYLAKVEAKVVMLPTSDDIVVRTRLGEFVDADLSKLNTVERNKIIVESYIKHAKERKAIAFCISIAHSEALADAFKAHGIKAEYVHGGMRRSDRDAVLMRLKHGETIVVTSRDILIEGFDEPSVSCVLMCRPTKSKTVYTQCVGRGLRTCQNKDLCVVLDFCEMGHSLRSACHMGSIDFFFLVSLSMMYGILDLALKIFGIIIGDLEKQEEKIQQSIRAGGGKKKRNIVKRIIGERSISILDDSKFIWVRLNDMLISPSKDQHFQTKAIVIWKKESAYHIYRIVNDDMQSMRLCIIDQNKGIDAAIHSAEGYAQLMLGSNAYAYDCIYLNGLVNYDQINHLSFLGITSKSTIGELNHLTANYFANRIHKAISVERPTPKQKAFLAKYNIICETKADASRIIGGIKSKTKNNKKLEKKH